MIDINFVLYALNEKRNQMEYVPEADKRRLDTECNELIRIAYEYFETDGSQQQVNS